MKIEVLVKKIIFQTQHGYVVFSGELLGQTQEITCSGNAPKLQKDVIFICEGEYVEHPTYGLQFAFQSIELSQHMNQTQLIYALRHLSEKSLTYNEIDQLIEHYGLDFIQILKNHTDIEHPIYDHLTKKMKKKLLHVFDMLARQEDEETITDVLIMCGLSSTMIGNISATFKDDLAKIIKSDPYELLRIDGVGFKSADKVGQWYKIEPDDIRRESALIYDIVSQTTFQRGDTYMTYEEIETQFISLDPTHTLAECFEFATMKQYIVVDDDLVYPAINYHAEKFISDFLNTHQPKPLPYNQIELRLKEVEATMGIELDPSQVDAILSFITLGHMVLTGGPGTGKTTIVKAILKLIEISENPRVVHCCAPTGRASKRLSQLTSHPASTLHSLLQWNKESNTFSRNESNPLQVDILIIDEMSMIDVVLFAHTLRACPPHVKLLLIGDPNQLPSVSPGNVLLDIMDSGVMKCVSLEYIYRQKSESDILRLAHSMLKHEWLNDLRHDVKHIESSAKHVREHVVTLITKALEKGYRIEDIQVLSPMYKGVAGVDALNHVCQKVFNPFSEEKREVIIHGKIFREFDKVLQLKNRPDDHVYNGDIGILVDVIHPYESDNQQLTLVVDYDGHFVEYQGDYLHQLTHAYALSVHKSQGSEYPIVILVAVNEYKTMLQSRLYYTGITRAANSLICVGEQTAFEKAAQQESQIVRRSTLKNRLMLEKSL
jgi:exodeoxyribonuclease V alpha subunit